MEREWAIRGSQPTSVHLFRSFSNLFQFRKTRKFSIDLASIQTSAGNGDGIAIRIVIVGKFVARYGSLPAFRMIVSGSILSGFT